jgi:hypothetical protein
MTTTLPVRMSSSCAEVSMASTEHPRLANGMLCMPKPAPKSKTVWPRVRCGRTAAISLAPRAMAVPMPPAIQI